MKHFLFFALALSLFFSKCFSQTASNDLKVIQIITPIKNINYNSPDSTDLVVRIQNKGPNVIRTYDSLYFSYSISQVDTSSVVSGSDFDTTINITTDIRVGGVMTITLVEDFPIRGSGTASICADITGSWEYPTNDNKFSGECSQFLVGVEEIDIKPSKVYFSGESIFIEMNIPLQARIQIFDITGKKLISRNFQSSRKQIIPFKSHSKGFYFLKITDRQGNRSTSKFVVN